MAKIKFRRDTAAAWTEADPTLAQGEPGFEHDTGLFKIGDGETAWTSLDYASSSGSSGSSLTDEGSVVITAGSTEHWVATQRRDNNDTEPRGLRYDSEGNLYSLTKTLANSVDITVITKYTAAGAVAWQKSFTNASPLALAVDSSDRAYITVQLDAPIITVIKFGNTGSILWKKDYDIGDFISIDAYIEEKNSTTLALAFTAIIGENYPNTALVMTISATDGTVQIKKQLALDNSELVRVTGIDVDPSENVFVTGYYYDATDDHEKMFIEKLNSSLGRVWSKRLQNENLDGYSMYGGDCASDALGNIYVVGSYTVLTTNSNSNESQQSAGILSKLNASGVVQWTRRLGPGPCGSFATGLTATATGDVYLSAVTFAKKSDGPQADTYEYVQEGYGSNKLIVVRYNTSGAVMWQRYVDVTNLYEYYDEETPRGQAIAVFGDKFAVDGYGYSSNTTPWNYSNTDDEEADYFAVQLPTDGTALTIGNLDFTESRVPARFITHTSANSPLLITTYAETVLAETSGVVADSEVRIASSIVKSEPYEYTFGADGTLTIPNDGDLRLTQTQVGYLMSLGGAVNNSDSIYGRAVTVDSQGNMYVAGEDEDEYVPFITKIDPDGVRVWGVTFDENNNGNDGRVNGITIHPTTGNLMVVCEFYGYWTYSVLFTVDQDTGRILDNDVFSDDAADTYLIDIAYADIGDSSLSYVIAGSKFGEFTAEEPLVKQSGSGVGVIKILRSSVDITPSNEWQIGGTGIDPFENIAYVERYTGLTGTVRQGSGAIFDIADLGDGNYYAAGMQNQGTNYLTGHKIKILGTDLGGATPANDCIVTVDSVSEGGVIFNWSVAGTPAGTEYALYTPVTGTNYNTGSGLVFTYEGPLSTTDYSYWQNISITSGGTNYVENDIVVFAGTSLGGTSPANNLTLRVGASGGVVNGLYDITGTSQSTTWKLETTTQVDFSQSGSWNWTRPLDRQNLIVTPTWQRTFGTAQSDTDRLYAVDIDTGNNIIAVGEGRGELLADDGMYGLAMVYKFNSAGALQWARQLNERGDDCYAKSVVTIGTDIYVTHQSTDEGETVITKLDSTGTVKWQRATESGDDSVIAATPDGNLLVAVEGYESGGDITALKVFLLTPSGVTIYKRWLYGAADEDTQFKNGRGLVVDGNSFYITAYVYANNYRSTLAARLPVDGTGTGEYGSFRYTDVNAMTGGEFENGLAGINYDINEVDLEGQYNYAGALSNGADPYVNDAEAVTVRSLTYFGGESFFPETTTVTVRDTDGGNIIFADGTKQNTSATDIPQRRYTGQRYTLGLDDRGHHILCSNDNDDSIIVPYNARVPFPIGTVITIVNDTGGNVSITNEGSSVYLKLAGSDWTGGVLLANNGMATLLKIYIDGWMISGNVAADD